MMWMIIIGVCALAILTIVIFLIIGYVNSGSKEPTGSKGAGEGAETGTTKATALVEDSPLRGKSPLHEGASNKRSELVANDSVFNLVNRSHKE